MEKMIDKDGKRMRRKALIAGIFTLLLLSCISMVLSDAFAFRVFATESPTLTLSSEFENEYAQGSRLVLPEGTISAGSGSATANALIRFPGGNVYEKQVVTLDRIGKYEVFYSALIGGKTYSVRRYFNVYGSLYSFSSSRSKAQYVTDFGYNNKTVSTGTVEGLKVSLASGDTLTFNRPIDVSKATNVDKLLSMVITPETLGEADVSRFSVVLTDVTDATNYVTVTAKIDPASSTAPTTTNRQRVYVAAAAQFQPLTGIEFQYNPPKLHVADSYGAIENKCSLYGTLNNATLAENAFDLRFDYATRGVHISNANYAADNRVSDLDDPYFYSVLWDGFATGEAYVSIRADMYQKEAFNFVVTQIDGQSDLTQNRFNDTTPPALDIETGEFGQNVPDAVVGKPYRVFNATAYDSIDGVLPVTVNVYRNYTGSSNRFNVAVTNGCFTPKNLLLYTIEYSAVDASGNRTVIPVPIEVVSADSYPISLSVAGDKATDGDYGARIPVAVYTVSGGVSTPKVTVMATKDAQAISIIDGEFTATEEGVWTIMYTASDYAGQVATETYNVTVTKGDAAVFRNKAVFPKYLIAGVPNEVPEYFAADYVNSEGNPVATTVRYVDEDGEHTAEGRKFTPKVANSGDVVTVKYVAVLNGVESYVSADIPAYIITQTDSVANASDYFVCSGGASATTTDEGAQISSAKSNAAVEFINPLVAGAFRINFTVNGVSRVRFTLTDSVDAEKHVSFTLVKNGNSVDAVDPTGITYHIYSATFGGNAFGFEFESLTNTFTLDSESGVRAPITVDDFGKAFTGFMSGKVYLSFMFLDEGVTTLTVQSLGNQNLAKERSDMAPQVYMGSEVTMLPLGGVAQIVPAYAGDVFDPCITFGMTVTKIGDVSPITDTHGVVLQHVDPTRGYEISVNEVTTYIVQFSAQDESGNAVSTRGSNYAINAIDNIAPVIKADAPQSEAKVGDKVFINKATATDNLDSDITVRVFIVTADGAMYEIGAEYDGFTADRAGEYTVMYIADDSTGNRTVVSYTIVAKEQ